jgi:NitT/TauT family transport system permease protein
MSSEATQDRSKTNTVMTLWSATWPKLAALALAIAAWQATVLFGGWPSWVLPGPVEVLPRVGEELASGAVLQSLAITLRRALLGFALATVAGAVIGVVLTTSRTLRSAVLALLTGLQTMPSVAWFPLAILLFQLGEAAILSVVVLGAAPSVAVGLVSSFDHVPPLWIRAGRSLGAHGWQLYRHVIGPAILPGFVAGLKQAWAFAWRSLMAGELLVIIGHQPSLGVRLQYARELSDAEGLLAWMIVVLAVGVAIESLVFAQIEAKIRARRGLGG